MFQLCLPLENFSESPTTWPKQGTTSRGHAYELPTWAPHTNENGFLLLPSPVAQQSGNPPEVHLRKKPGRHRVTDLAIIVENGLLETGGEVA
jgi:DNA (cytosine-5)-methyltransferase 1